MPIVKANEPLPARPVILVIFGDPGVCKTSLFNTCDTPLLLDFDRGVDRSHGRKDTMVLKNWQELLDSERAGELEGYKTIGIDTAKACIDDYLMLHVIEKDHKLAYNKLRAFGEVGDEFKLFTNRCRAKDADIVVIAHAKKDDDTKKFLPDVTGQSYALLMRIADQVGYVTIENGKRVISFEPTDMKVGKNVACLPTMEIPDKNTPEFANFGAKLVSDVREAIARMSKEQAEAMELSNKYQDRINGTEDIKTLKDILPELDALPDYLKLPLYQVFGDKHKEAIQASETPEYLTEMIFVVNNLPEFFHKALKSTIMNTGTERGWTFSKDDGCWSIPDNKPQVGKKEPESKLFAKKHKTVAEVAADISIATTELDMGTIYKYNKELIERDDNLAAEYTVKMQELSDTKATA